MSRYCNICGNEISDNEQFCPVCGSEVRGFIKREASNESLYAHGRDNIQQVSSDLPKPQKKYWYTYNWKRFFKEPWNAGAKHHCAWIGLNLLGITVGVMLICGIISCCKYIGRNVTNAFSTGKTEVSAGSFEEYDEAIEDIKEYADNVENTVDYYAKVAFNSLEGTWTDSYGTFTLTIGKDGTVKISDSTGTVGAEAFTWSEVDDDTIRLKAESSGFLASFLSIDMDYEVQGETLTVSLMGKSFDLKRKK